LLILFFPLLGLAPPTHRVRPHLTLDFPRLSTHTFNCPKGNFFPPFFFFPRPFLSVGSGKPPLPPPPPAFFFFFFFGAYPPPPLCFFFSPHDRIYPRTFPSVCTPFSVANLFFPSPRFENSRTQSLSRFVSFNTDPFFPFFLPVTFCPQLAPTCAVVTPRPHTHVFAALNCFPPPPSRPAPQPHFLAH